MSAELAPGVRVLCVETATPAQVSAWSGLLTFPVVGSIYTVRKSGPCVFSGEPAVLLREIVNPPFDFGVLFDETAFRADWFKPLDERRLDVFRAILTGIQKASGT